jgi:hypothetical protein
LKLGLGADKNIASFAHANAIKERVHMGIPYGYIKNESHENMDKI